MQFKVRILTVDQMDYSEPELRESFDMTCDCFEDAEEGAIMHLDLLDKNCNGNLWENSRIIISIRQVA